MRSVVIDRIGEFPLETNESVADFLLTNCDVMDGVDLLTVINYVSEIRDGGTGYGRKPQR
jgi:hypothetical protein